MRIEPFALERWFGEHEHDAEIMLAESGIRSLDASRFDTDPGELGYVIPTDGDPELRAAIGERYGRSEEEVLCTCGTQEANFLAFLALCSEPDAEADPSAFRAGDSNGGNTVSGRRHGREPHAVVVVPTYQALSAVPDAFGSVTEVPLEEPDWSLPVEAVADAVRPETRAIVLANPNNPTGRYHPEERVRALYDLAADNDAYLFCDEVYRLLAEDPFDPVAGLGPHGLSTASLTKAHGLAGLRFGWLVGDRELIDLARRWKDYTTISPPLVGQHVARQVLTDPDREAEIIAENRRLAGENRDRVRAFLDEHGLEWYDPVGVNGFVSVPEGFADAREFCRQVVESESVVLAPGECFGYPDRFRIGFGLEPAALTEGLERLERFLSDRAASTA
ncbi:aminotransferase class I/II-fold pyridoxal phosphate-dependent enzyme [Saliphagus sp. LR7]|uniref:aminotransferase class I/II-fold pyridoxal phosphate-dependent enzyme n=1 Tax=Saliphagus sp. LR7 TaxID=2282654 RepID=UPI000DF8479F|nr:aminotransferase class I/II-fold pyridoxal phosphate-dependent enzyme [Saliphagus sp. LR7]